MNEYVKLLYVSRLIDGLSLENKIFDPSMPYKYSFSHMFDDLINGQEIIEYIIECRKCVGL